MLNNRLFQAVSAAAVGAALAMALPGFSPAVEASTTAPAMTPEQTPPQPDACSQRAWPYYGAECLHSQAASPARVVRIVSTDRLPK